MAWKCGGQVRMDVCVAQHWKHTRGVLVQWRSMELTLHRGQRVMARTMREPLTDGDREPGRDVKRSVGRCLACAVCCRLLRERALAKRRGEQSERGMEASTQGDERW